MRTQVLSYDRMRYFISQLEGKNLAANKSELRAARTVLGAAIERELTPRQQECVRLYFYEGFTMDEIAKQLGVSKPVVWRHLQRAKKKLEHSLLYAALASHSADED